ncbi:response regulator transcription factor [Spirochaetes bacterium]|uniref:Response regulator transcription factor n=1 Tax=Candidatus Scatousia excrementipullorum TaxID=2840936 RepID=A0A9D9DMU8_9BACT|nr:response regulator transcription factor [Candidatus Scatousia excrementipullorum]
MTKKNILIVEDHELTRFGLKTAFEGVDFVGELYEAESAEKALEIFNEHNIDVVIMDLGLPAMNGIDATKRIRSSNKDVKVIILTSHNDEKEVLNSLRAGANAYCSKEINPQRLIQVVQSVADGAAWFDPSIAHIVLKATANSPVIDSENNSKAYDLTSRETQILKLMTEGYSNMEIAQILVISINTTKAHVANILQKLEVDDRLQAALKALKYKIV